jgi:hypothetical protein
MKYIIEIDSGGMRSISSFIKISTAVEGILRSFLRNLKERNVGITSGDD